MEPLGAAEAVEAGGGQHQRVALAFAQLAQAGVDVAAQLDEAEVGAQGEELGAAARAGGADEGAGGQGVQRLLARTDVGVAGVGARRDGGESEARIERGGQVLERVDGEVDAAFGERLFDLLDEDSLAIAGGAGAGLRRGWPVLASACKRSPVVWMISISTAWPAARKASAMWLACQSASWEPREPMRMVSVMSRPEYGKTVAIW